MSEKENKNLLTVEEIKKFNTGDSIEPLRIRIVTIGFDEEQFSSEVKYSARTIAKLLKLYGASTKEIKNFIEDLKLEEIYENK